MKILPLLFFFLPYHILAQKMPDYVDKVRIVEDDKVIQAEIRPVTSDPHMVSNRFYFWYSANIIHTTQGGYSGTLLNGLYNEYYLNRNLREQGIFKKGLKDGVWKTWKEDGTLNMVVFWKDGVLVPEGKVSFWTKLNLFKKKQKTPAASPTAPIK